MKKYKSLLIIVVAILITGCGTKSSTAGNNTAGELPKETSAGTNTAGELPTETTTEPSDEPEETEENHTIEPSDFSNVNKIGSFCINTEYYSENQEILNEFIAQLNTGILYEENVSEGLIGVDIGTFNLYNGDEKLYEIAIDQSNNICINGQCYSYKGINFIKTYSDIFKENPVNIDDMGEIQSITVFYMGEQYISEDAELIQSLMDIIHDFGTLEPFIPDFFTEVWAGGHFFICDTKSGTTTGFNIGNEYMFSYEEGQCFKVSNAIDLDKCQQLYRAVYKQGQKKE